MKNLPNPIGIYAILDANVPDLNLLFHMAEEFYRGGVRVFQVRGKTLTSREFFLLSKQVKSLLPNDAILIINDRFDVALLVGADGVHVGDEDLSPERLRSLTPEGFIIGYSTHSVGEIAKAECCDYVGFGPVFYSKTKQTERKPLGVESVIKAVQVSHCPVVAIGGISLEHICVLAETGVNGIAMISGLMRRGEYFTNARLAVEEFTKGFRKALVRCIP